MAMPVRGGILTCNIADTQTLYSSYLSLSLMVVFCAECQKAQPWRRRVRGIYPTQLYRTLSA